MDHEDGGAEAFESLAAELELAFRRWTERPPEGEELDGWAAKAFRFQYDHNPIYRAFCDRRGVGARTVHGWRDVPAVPTAAFKQLELRSGPPAPLGSDGAVFLTSGTTAGREQRGRHFVPRLSLYRAALIGPFRTHVVPDRERIRFLSLIPHFPDAPDSSLSYMVTAAAEEMAIEADWLVDAGGALDVDAFRRCADEAVRGGEPVLLLGTALAFAHLVERLGEPLREPLPQGSRVMETGGFKGLNRSVSRADLYESVSATTGVQTSRIVSEYGMTELLSQLYEPVLAEGAQAGGEHVPAPSLSVRAVDPMTLEEVDEGREGILSFFDLANLGSVCAVLTEDVGSVVRGRVRLRGRLEGAEPRGCSRAMDELLAVGGRREGR